MAVGNLDQAATLDSKWKSLAGAARSLTGSLEAGTTPSQSVVIELSNQCHPFDTAAG